MKSVFYAMSLISCLLITGHTRAESLFFLRIADMGRYTVTVGDQSLTLSTGRYRFFELPAGQARVTIAQNNIAVYQGWVDLSTDSRIVAEFSNRQGLRVVGVSPLNVDGRFWEWNGPSGVPPRPGHYDNIRSAISLQEFDRIQAAVSKQSFDDDKYDLLMSLIGDQYVTSAQLAELLKQFTFDGKRLEAAKRAWKQVADRENYFKVFDSFSFTTSVNDLKAFLSTR